MIKESTQIPQEPPKPPIKGAGLPGVKNGERLLNITVKASIQEQLDRHAIPYTHSTSYSNLPQLEIVMGESALATLYGEVPLKLILEPYLVAMRVNAQQSTQ